MSIGLTKHTLKSIPVRSSSVGCLLAQLTQTEIRIERKFEITVPQITDSFSDAEELYSGYNGGHKFLPLSKLLRRNRT